MTREEAIERLEFLKGVYSVDTETALDMAIEALTVAVSREDTVTLNSPISIQAEMVSVVRCKDCKNWRESHSEDDESYCYIDGRTTDNTDYCSWGERAEQTDNKLSGYEEVIEALDNLKLEFTIHGTERVKRMVGDDHE